MPTISRHKTHEIDNIFIPSIHSFVSHPGVFRDIKIMCSIAVKFQPLTQTNEIQCVSRKVFSPSDKGRRKVEGMHG